MTVEENNNKVSFEELLNESVAGPGWLEPGQRMEARIVDIGADWIFLDLGGKSEGILDKKEMLDANGELNVKVGDTIMAYFLSSRNDELMFTTRITRGTTGLNFLEEAMRNDIPVEGVIEKEIKGGFQVKIAGDTAAFCPYSQMGLRGQGATAEYVGQRMLFIITEYGEKGRNVILSNRAIREAEMRVRLEELKEELREGMKIKGTVASIQDFGAFVDIGGMQGLIPISEIGWTRVEDVSEVLSVGQELETVILKLDWEKNRVSLSRKATLPDPWDNVEAKYPAGSSHTGTVARLTKFGAFVTLEGGVDGLIHISKLGGGKRLNYPSEVLVQGQTVEVTVQGIDLEKRRITLVPEREARGKVEPDAPGDDDYREYLGKTHSSMGTLGDLLRKKLKNK